MYSNSWSTKSAITIGVAGPGGMAMVAVLDGIVVLEAQTVT
jgi:hypothetical protein